MNKGFRNKYELKDDYIILYIERKTGEIFECLIDTEDLPKLKELNRTWSIKIDGRKRTMYVACMIECDYVSNKQKRTQMVMQRFLMGVQGVKNIRVDHINHNYLDNRKSNLRIVTVQNNCLNRKGKNTNNKSGYRNVQWDKIRQKWSVILQINGRAKRLGSFDDIDEAGLFAEQMRDNYYGEFAGDN